MVGATMWKEKPKARFVQGMCRLVAFDNGRIC